MQAICNRFNGMQNFSWKQLKSSFYSIIDTIKSSLHRLSGELDNMSIMVTDHGMISGENIAKELVLLKKCKWIDALLPSGQVFVAECCDRVTRLVDTRIKKKRAELEWVINTNLTVNGGSSPNHSGYQSDASRVA